MKKYISTFMIGVVSFFGGFYLGGKVLVDMINSYKTRMKRNLANMMIFNDWVDFLYSGGSVEQYFNKNNFHKIMIYGNGFIGTRLMQALEKTDIKVTAVMDKAVVPSMDGMVIGLEADIPDVDCIVITPVYYYDEIYSMLTERAKIPIISVKDLFTV